VGNAVHAIARVVFPTPPLTGAPYPVRGPSGRPGPLGASYKCSYTEGMNGRPVTAAPRRFGQLVELARPVTLAGERTLPVLPAFAGLLPEGGLRRGTTILVDPAAGCAQAGTSLALALLAGASAAGSWCAAAGIGQLGLVGGAAMGIDLSRLALVPEPGRAFANAVAALIDAIDVVLVSPQPGVRPGDARRLAARARERGSVLVILEPGLPQRRPGSGWPVPADLRFVPLAAEWQGLAKGHGHLQARRVEIEVSGRGAAARRLRSELWLPAVDGTVREVRERRGVVVGVDHAVPGPTLAVANGG
jgi:hypothetical protein